MIEGELSDRMQPAFEAMTLTREHGNTVLSGTVRDQAQLHGLIERIAELGLELVSVNPIDPT